MSSVDQNNSAELQNTYTAFCIPSAVLQRLKEQPEIFQSFVVDLLGKINGGQRKFYFADSGGLYVETEDDYATYTGKSGLDTEKIFQIVLEHIEKIGYVPQSSDAISDTLRTSHDTITNTTGIAEITATRKAAEKPAHEQLQDYFDKDGARIARAIERYYGLSPASGISKIPEEKRIVVRLNIPDLHNGVLELTNTCAKLSYEKRRRGEIVTANIRKEILFAPEAKIAHVEGAELDSLLSNCDFYYDGFEDGLIASGPLLISRYETEKTGADVTWIEQDAIQKEPTLRM